MLSLDKKYVDEMVSHAQSEAPNECCGVLAGKQGQVIKLFRATNAVHSPVRYNVAADDLIRIYREISQNNWELLAIYHSHPKTEAYPSETDIKYAFLPEAIYIIVSLADAGRPAIEAFHIVDRKIEREPINILG